MSLASLAAPLMHFNIGDGSLRFSIEGQHNDYLNESSIPGITIRSRTAPVLIESALPVALKMPSATASRALVRAVGGAVPAKTSGGELKMHLSPVAVPSSDQYSIPIDVEVDNGALYVDVRSLEMNEVGVG